MRLTHFVLQLRPSLLLDHPSRSWPLPLHSSQHPLLLRSRQQALLTMLRAPTLQVRQRSSWWYFPLSPPHAQITDATRYMSDCLASILLIQFLLFAFRALLNVWIKPDGLVGGAVVCLTLLTTDYLSNRSTHGTRCSAGFRLQTVWRLGGATVPHGLGSMW